MPWPRWESPGSGRPEADTGAGRSLGLLQAVGCFPQVAL